jgi:hypothetical protein
MMDLKQIDRNPTPAVVRRFGRRTVLAAPIAGLVWLVVIRLMSGGWHPWLPLIIGGGGLVLGLFCALAPRLSHSVHVAWHVVIAVIDWLVIGILLSLVFFLVFTPVGVCLRLAGRRTVRRRPDPDATTYWQKPEKVTDLRRYYRQF